MRGGGGNARNRVLARVLRRFARFPPRAWVSYKANPTNPAKSGKAGIRAFGKFAECDKLRSVSRFPVRNETLQVRNETLDEFPYRGRELGRKSAIHILSALRLKRVHVFKKRRGRVPNFWKFHGTRIFSLRLRKFAKISRRNKKNHFSWIPFK